MKFLVGGAVRDKLLGLPVTDVDWVVVGSSIKEMLANNFKQVGSAFPVFLHPATNEEYALARTEKTTGGGYKDFDFDFGPDVTLETDLSRRDLTINAIAYDEANDVYIDPCNGLDDIDNKILRHVSDAFKEDPVRILRLYRFHSTLGEEWTIAPETTELVEEMVASGALVNLTPERVTKELFKALDSDNPELFIRAMAQFDLYPEIKEMYTVEQDPIHHPEGNVGIHTELTTKWAAVNHNAHIALAALLHDMGKAKTFKEHGNFHGHEAAGVEDVILFCERWKISNKDTRLAIHVCEHHTRIHSVLGRNGENRTKPKKIMKLFEETRALDNREHFVNLLHVAEADAKGRGPTKINKPYHQTAYLLACLDAAKAVDTKLISNRMLDSTTDTSIGKAIGEAIRVERIAAIRSVYKTWK